MVGALDVSATDAVALDVGEGAEILDAAVSVGMAIGEPTAVDAAVLIGAAVSDDEAPEPAPLCCESDDEYPLVCAFAHVYPSLPELAARYFP